MCTHRHKQIDSHLKRVRGREREHSQNYLYNFINDETNKKTAKN